MDDYIEDLLTKNEMEIDFIEALDSATITENNLNSVAFLGIAELELTFNIN